MVLASIEFGVVNLGIRHVVVMSHTNCGAVAAAMDALDSGEIVAEKDISSALEGLDADATIGAGGMIVTGSSVITAETFGDGEASPPGLLAKTEFTAMGMVTLLAYVLIAVSLGISHIASWPWLVLLAFAIWSQFMLFLFPMDDLTQEARTRTGKLHSIFALLGFILFYIFVIFVPLSASWAQSGWITSAVVLTHLGFWSMLLVAVIPALRCVVGLAERIYLIAVPYWFLAVAALWLATGY